jgi:hypothetical protein
MAMSFDREARDNRHGYAIDTVAEFERSHGHQVGWRQLLDFMIEYLSLSRSDLPVEAQKVFSVAERFRAVSDINAEFERIRDSCWCYLLSVEFRYDFANRENCAIRAALCLIRREPPRIDLADTCYWFLSFADQFEDHSELIAGLADKYFANGVANCDHTG